MNVETYVALGLDRAPATQVNGRSNLDIVPSLEHAGDAAYHPCPEAFPDPGVPVGSVTKHADWDSSRIYANTRRNLYVYTPATLDPSRPVQLVVFNDGYGYVSRRGSVRAAQVLDTLHARGDIEPTVAVFVNPRRPNDAMLAQTTAETPGHNPTLRQCSFEFGAGGRSLRHAGALFADALRWLRRSAGTQGETG